MAACAVHSQSAHVNAHRLWPYLNHNCLDLTSSDNRRASGIGPGNSIARDVKLAEMLIGKRAAPSAAQLADPTVQLKVLLKG